MRRYSVPGPDNNAVPALVIRPKGGEGALPCPVYIHGGSIIFPAAPYHYTLAREYAAQTGCAVVFPDCRCAPRHPYPAAAEDCWAVYQWLCREAAGSGGRARGIF